MLLCNSDSSLKTCRLTLRTFVAIGIGDPVYESKQEIIDFRRTFVGSLGWHNDLKNNLCFDSVSSLHIAARPIRTNSYSYRVTLFINVLGGWRQLMFCGFSGISSAIVNTLRTCLRQFSRSASCWERWVSRRCPTTSAANPCSSSASGQWLSSELSPPSYPTTTLSSYYDSSPAHFSRYRLCCLTFAFYIVFPSYEWKKWYLNTPKPCNQ